MLAPVVNLFRRLRLGRVASVLLAVLLSLAVVLALGGIVGTQLAGVASDLPRYQTNIQEKAHTLRGLTIERFSSLVGRVTREVSEASKPAVETQKEAPTSSPDQSQAPPPLPVEIHQPPPSPLDLARSIISPILGPIATAAIVFIVAIFILLQQHDLRDRFIRLFGSSDLHRTTVALDDAAARLSRYFLTQLAVNACFGLIIGIGLFFIGIPSPALWGVLAALLRFVPYMGALLAGIAPVVLAAAIDPGWSMTIGVAALFLITEPIIGQIVEPLLYGRSTGLSPVSVVVSAIFWAWIWDQSASSWRRR